MEFILNFIDLVGKNYIFFSCAATAIIILSLLCIWKIKTPQRIKRLFYLLFLIVFSGLALLIDKLFIHKVLFDYLYLIYYGLIVSAALYIISTIFNDIIITVIRLICVHPKKATPQDVNLNIFVETFTKNWVRNKGNKSRAEYIKETRKSYINELTNQLKHVCSDSEKQAIKAYKKYSK